MQVPLSKELEQLTDEFCAMVKPIVQRMNKSGWLRFHDPKRLNVMLLMEACNDFKSKSQEHGLPQDEISQVMSDFNALLSLIPALKELQTHGTWSFHKALLNYAQNPQMNRTKQWLFKQNSWRRLMQRLTKMEESGRHLVHPKLLKLSGKDLTDGDVMCLFHHGCVLWSFRSIERPFYAQDQRRDI